MDVVESKGSTVRRRRRRRKDIGHKYIKTVFWSDIRHRVDNSKITPYISNSISNDLVFGEGFEDVIDEWASSTGFPWQQSPSVCRVAQYWRIREDDSSARQVYLNTLKSAILDRAYEDDRVDDRQYDKVAGREEDSAYSFTDMVRDLGYLDFKSKELRNHPLSILARLPLNTYVTTSYHRFLEEALAQWGKANYVSELYPWNDVLEADSNSIFMQEPGFQPSLQRPMVYHLFGRDDKPDSLVLTENDHLDFLIRVTRDMATTRVARHSRAEGDLIIQGLPTLVDDTLTQTSLLLLGYEMQSWDFRVLFRGLITSRNETRNREGIFIQMLRGDSEGERQIKEALERYLLKTSRLKIYWGTPAACLLDLYSLWRPRQDTGEDGG